MKNKMFILLKKIILSFIILYGFNTIGSNFNIIIPMNVITIGIITVLGLPALFSLVFLLVFAL